jgi:uncharacterized tellurite resistance protein B-like protein
MAEEGMDEKLRAELVREITDFLEKSWPDAARDGSAAITDHQLRLAAAILMVSVVRVDRASRQDEHRALERAVGQTLDLDPEAAAVVVRAAEDAMARGVSFSGVLQRLEAGCSADQRKRLVESLWQIAFADAELAGHEEYLVRKIAGQLDLTTADLMETKIRARERFLEEGL